MNRTSPSTLVVSGETKKLLSEFCSKRMLKKVGFADFILMKVLGHLVEGRYTIDQVCGQGSEQELRAYGFYFNGAKLDTEDWTQYLKKPTPQENATQEG